MKQSMINKRQYIILSFYLTRVLFLGIGFSILVGIGKNSLLIASILGMLLGYFLLYLFYKKGGLSKISNVLISITTLTASLLAITTLTGTYLLYDTPTLFIMGAFFLVLIYGASKELKITSRVSELFCPLSGLFIIFSLFALISLVSLYNLLPVFNTSFWEFLKCIIVFTATSLMPNLLLLNYKDDLKFKDVGRGYLLGAILTII
ncbi:MAG: GerAB/ArcD/ProY family transporter, partial [Bacilli bacterium]|nr:GerAB/ArcD/ProY family transporter [Bacilli bacterium]